MDLEDIDVISDVGGEALNTVESVLGENDVEDLNECATKSKRKTITPGIVYLSRIPPFMKPVKIRQLLSEYGEVGRVFLQPEGEMCIIILVCCVQKVERFRGPLLVEQHLRTYILGKVQFCAYDTLTNL